MPTVAKPDEIADALNAPTLDGKTTPIKKTAESKVSLDADAVPARSVPHRHAAHSRPSVPRQRVAQRRLALPNALPCCRAWVTHMIPSLVLFIGWPSAHPLAHPSALLLAPLIGVCSLPICSSRYPAVCSAL